MKILQVNNNHRIIGGSDTVYFNTGSLLKEAGHKVNWFAGSDPQNLPALEAHYFPPVIDTRSPRATDTLRYFHNGKAKHSMQRFLGELGYFDVAHLHIYYGRLTASILSPLMDAGIPIVQSLHEYKLACPIYTLERDGQICDACVNGSKLNVLRYRCKGSLSRSIIALTEFYSSRLQGDVSRISQFICVSEFQRHLLLRAGIPETKMVTLHNFVDPSALLPSCPTDRSDYLLYFGRIERLKGVPTLIQAVQRTGNKLIIAGTGSWTEEMQAEISGCDNIEYLGFVSGDPLRKLVASARAVVVPSEWYENCPMSVLEAKAVGTPVIGARIGGIPELVREGVDGYLFRPGDSNDLAHVLEAVMDTDMDAMGEEARVDVESRFSPKVHLERLLRIYADAQSTLS